MTKTLTRHGNSLALVIDKPVLDLLGIDERTPLTITTDGSSLLVSPAKGEKHRARLREALLAVNRKHAGALRKLAE